MASIFDTARTRTPVTASKPASLSGLLAQKQAQQQPIRSAAGGATAPAAAAPKPSGLAGQIQGNVKSAMGTIANAAAYNAGLNRMGAAAQQQAGNAMAASAAQQQQAQQAKANQDYANSAALRIHEQMGSARAVGQGIQQQGNAAQAQQNQLAQNLGGIAGTYRVASQNNQFAPGTRATAGNLGSVSNVDPNALGGYGSVAGQLGAAPGAVSTGQLGGVGMAAGNLGGGYQVGNVGNIQTGAGPGNVAGTFGNQGVSGADQASMLSRINQFLDQGNGPSMAEAQLKQAQAQNMSQMLGLARSGRGGAGAQAQALAGAMSEGGAIASDTAGQLATLRAQEEDMLKNRSLSAMGLGGDLATAARGQDIGIRGQNLQAAQGDQSAQLAGRGQDLQAAMANQATQSQLEQLRANTATATRGQDLSALQGDQSAQLGMRGQNLSALQGNQQTALGARGQNLDALGQDLNAQIAARGQNLSALQGNQQSQLGARGQNLTQEGNILNANTALRAQDLANATSNADRSLAAQQLSLQGQLGYRGLANDAMGLGLQAQATANQQALGAEGLAQDANNQFLDRRNAITLAQYQGDNAVRAQNAANDGQMSFGQNMALAGVGALGAIGGGLATLSDENAKTGIRDAGSAFGDHLRVSPGKRYRYKPGVGEDPAAEHGGPMAQDLERSPFGASLVRKGPDGLRRVDTGRLALVDHAALSEMRSELDVLKASLGRGRRAA